MNVRNHVHVASLAELLPVADSAWTRELALVDRSPVAKPTTTSRESRGEPQRICEHAAVPPPSRRRTTMSVPS